MFWKSNKPPFRHTGCSPEAAEYLAAQLERLMALPLITPTDLEHWHTERYAIERELETRFPHFLPEHEVGHFFDDADIRSRDIGYRDYQHGMMSQYVRFLRNEPPTPTPQQTPLLPDAQWICYFVIAFTGYLFATKPTQTTGQLVFRLALMLGGAIGLLLLWLRKKPSC
jgi:hypothetical protein